MIDAAKELSPPKSLVDSHFERIANERGSAEPRCAIPIAMGSPS